MGFKLLMHCRANFNWKLVLLVAVFLPILLRLGLWQLDRAEEKRRMLESYHELIAAPALALDALPAEAYQNYQQISFRGIYQDKVFLVDNQHYQNTLGYEVVQAVEAESGQTVLVSRGWLKSNQDRRQLPDILYPSSEKLHHFYGYLYQPSEALLFDEEAASENNPWPRLVQSVNVEKLYNALGINDKIPHRFLIRLDPISPGAYIPHWQVVNIKPEKHSGYAVQWFAIAAVLLLGFIIASCRPTKRYETEHHEL